MKKVHFIAIGGSAMHNLAIALSRKGYHVTGSQDKKLVLYLTKKIFLPSTCTFLRLLYTLVHIRSDAISSEL